MPGGREQAWRRPAPPQLIRFWSDGMVVSIMCRLEALTVAPYSGNPPPLLMVMNAADGLSHRTITLAFGSIPR
jgi:hypothetical protein